MSPRCTGIYGLFRLDGGPIGPRDAIALGLAAPTSDSSALIEPVDLIEPGCIHFGDANGQMSVLLGYIDDAADLAARLAMHADTPPLTLALAALDRFGNDLPREMPGGWTLLRWDDAARHLTISQSINDRNSILFTRRGTTVAIAPEIQTLLRLDGISDAIDPSRLIDIYASNGLAPEDDNRLLVSTIRRLSRGATLRIDAAGEQIHKADPRLPVAPWRGSFDEAMAAATDLLRCNVRGVLARAAPGRVGAFNSGGLDSSTLSWLASSEKPAGSLVPLLASAVAPERGVDDEIPFSRIVADHLGEPLYPVIPPNGASPYRPRVADFQSANVPPRSPRNYLYDSFKDQAQALGLSHILDGALGELTLTTPMELPNLKRRIHLQLRALRMRFTHPDLRGRWPDDATSIWLAPALMASLPSALHERWRHLPSGSLVRRRGESWGYPPNILAMMERTPPEFSPGRVRIVTPFLDIRLLQLFAGFPTDYMTHGGLDRSPARHVLRGNLPDSISLRPKGLAFSPDYHQRLGEHAAAAAARIPLFRQAGLGEWFDLDRLEAGLGHIHRFDRAQLNSTFKIQLTAQNCEFFLWWVNGRPASEVAG